LGLQVPEEDHKTESMKEGELAYIDSYSWQLQTVWQFSNFDYFLAM
jgi:hypothetical protein